MRIPVYEEPQVNSRFQPSTLQAGQNVQAPIDRSAAGWGKLAEGLGSIADVTGKIALEEREKEDLKALQDAKIKYLKFSSSIMDGETDANGQFKPGLSQTQGDNAKNLEPTYRAAHDKTVSELDSGIMSPRAKELFGAWQQEQYLNNSVRLNKHQSTETYKSQVVTANALLKTEQDTAVKRYMTEGVLDLDGLEKAATDAGAIQGLNISVIEGQVKEAKSSVYKNIIETGLNSDDPKAAMKMVGMFEKFKEDDKLSVADIKALDDKVKTVSENFYGTDAGNVAYLNGMAGVTVNMAPPVDKMLKTVEEDADLTDGEKKIAKATINDNYAKYRQEKTLKQEELSNVAHGAKSYKEGMQAVNKAKGIVDDEARDRIMDALDHKFKITENKNKGEAEAKQMRLLQQQANLFTFQTKYVNGDYGTLTPAQVATKYTKELGAFTDNAMAFINDANKNLGQAKVNDSDMKDMLRILSQNKDYAKMLPNMDKPTEQDKAKLALLQQSVQSLMAKSKDAPGKGLTMQQAVLKAIEPLKTDSGTFSDTREPMYLIGSDMSSKYGKNPASWPIDSQNKYISEKFYANPANKGKRLSFDMLKNFRSELAKGN